VEVGGIEPACVDSRISALRQKLAALEADRRRGKNVGDGSLGGEQASKNTICLWFNRDAEEAATFYAATFPDSEVTGVFRAPVDFPGGSEGDVLTVEFTVFGTACLGLNGGRFSRSPSVLVSDRNG
jgi:3-demethylubiquinone-9 3-methyltransferase